MIKVIDLRSEYSTNPIFVNFNRQAYAIPTLYAKSLPKFESNFGRDTKYSSDIANIPLLMFLYFV